jgi:hypothetical protein
MEHPYKEFESLSIWKSIDRAVTDLEENNDLQITTAREYVIGYLCKSVVESYNADEAPK